MFAVLPDPPQYPRLKRVLSLLHFFHVFQLRRDLLDKTRRQHGELNSVAGNVEIVHKLEMHIEATQRTIKRQGTGEEC